MFRYFKIIVGLGSGNYIYYWKSKGLSDERISSTKTPGYAITPKLHYYGTTRRVELIEAVWNKIKLRMLMTI